MSITKKELVDGKAREGYEYNKYWSLYDYLKYYKKYKIVSPIYKSAFLQNRESDSKNGLIIACEHFDGESIVTDKNYAKILKMVGNHDLELMRIYNKQYIHVIRYSYA